MKTERIIHSWGIITLDGKGPYLAGLEPSGLLRTSTALVHFDPETMTARTASGRPYRLAGPEVRREAMNALLSIWDIGNAKLAFLDMDEVLPTIVRNGNQPQDFSREEKAENRRLQVEYTARSVAHFVGLCERWHGIALEDLADATTLPLEEWRGLVEGKPSDTVTVEQAEDALRLASMVFNGEIVIAKGRKP